MKKFVFILLMALSVQGFSTWVILVRDGGRVNNDGSVTYRHTSETDLGFLYISRCKGSGPNVCPRVGHIEVGGIPVIEIQNVAEKLIREKLAQGINYGRTVYKGVLIIWKDAIVRDGNNLEYKLGATDKYNKYTLIPDEPMAF